MPPHFIGIIFTRFFRQKRTASSIRIWIIELCSCLSQNGAALYSTRGCCIALTFCETYVLHCVCRMITLGLEIKSRMMTDQPLWRPVSSAATWWLLSLWQDVVAFCQRGSISSSSSFTRSSSCSGRRSSSSSSRNRSSSSTRSSIIIGRRRNSSSGRNRSSSSTRSSSSSFTRSCSSSGSRRSHSGSFYRNFELITFAMS